MITFTAATWTAIIAQPDSAARAQALADLLGADSTIEFLDAADAVIRTITVPSWTAGATAGGKTPITPSSYTDAALGSGTPVAAVFKDSGGAEVFRCSCGTAAGNFYRLLANIVAGVPVIPGAFALHIIATGGAVPAPPVFTTGPSIVGVLAVGETLTVVPGSVSGTPSPERTYQWLADGSEILVGATSTSFVLTIASVGKRISVRETATNDYGVAEATSAQTSVVQAALTVAVPPNLRIARGGDLDLSRYVFGGLAPYTYEIAGVLQSGVTPNTSTGILSAAADAPLGTQSGLSLAVTDSAGNADADWLARSTGAGVIWAHDFSESNDELEFFVRGTSSEASKVTNPDPAKQLNPLILEQTDLGSSRALRSRAVGTLITADVGQIAKGATQTIQVADASLFPAPGGNIGNYNVFIGCADPSADNTTPTVFEMCAVIARDTVANTLTVRRTTASSSIRVGGIDYPPTGPNAPAIPASNGLYRIGYTNSGSWNRPMCAFPAGQNGRAVNDQGLINGAAMRMRTWNPTRNGNGHAYFREGYWGSKWYWDTTVNPSAPYGDWTPTHNGDGQGFARIDAWEGDEFYLQFRFKISAARLQSARAKLFYIQNAATSGAAQVFADVGAKRNNVQPPPEERVAGSVIGNPVLTLAGGGDSRQPAGGVFTSNKQGDSFDSGATPWHVDYPTGLYSRKDLPDCYAFCHQSDVWMTMQVHMKLGRDNAESTQPAGVNSMSISPPWPSATDQSFCTTLDVKVAMPGWTSYKTLVDVNDATWFFGDDLGRLGNLVYNAPGLNCFWMTQEFNMYVGGGSLCPPDGVASALFTQAILSRNPIPVPLV